jgi:hypothetical protein
MLLSTPLILPLDLARDSLIEFLAAVCGQLCEDVVGDVRETVGAPVEVVTVGAGDAYVGVGGGFVVDVVDHEVAGVNGVEVGEDVGLLFGFVVGRLGV